MNTTLKSEPSFSPSELVKGAQVDKRVYTEQAVFDLEMERLFSNAWVYIAHESQVKNSGDYITVRIGKESLILVRDDKSQLRLLYNRCAHRGAQLVTDDAKGNVSKFVCNFHAYSFNTDGTIAGIPLQDSYDGTDIGKYNQALNLRQVKDLQSYQGFIFARLNTGNISLEDWLGDARATIDNFVDRAPEGEVEVVGRPYRWVNNCNWKMLVENLVDGMHVGGVHPSIGQTATKLTKKYEAANSRIPPILEMAQSFWQSNEFIRRMGVTLLPNGHCYNGGKVSIHSAYSEVPEYIDAMTGSYGAVKTKEILSQQRHNTGIYPNLHMKTMIQKIRVFVPVSPDKTLVECWVFRLKGAPEEMLRRTITYAEMLDSPASLVSTDDVEVMMRMQHGLQSDSEQMVDMNRGLNREEIHEGDAIHCEGDSERPFIKQYEVWKQLMNNQLP